MDPALRAAAQGEVSGETEAIIRLAPGAATPPQVRLVARFGEIATCRLPRERIWEIWSEENVTSLKAPRPFGIDPDPLEGTTADGEELEANATDVRRPPDLSATGQGVLVGVIDWGFDFAHPNLRYPSGLTRIRALWDQSASGTGPEPYGYGRVYRREEIDAALASDDPYAALGYHPASGDPQGRGAHGTHVVDIAAGSGMAAGSPLGLAPGAELLCVHLANRGTGGLATLGDSVTLLEALHWIFAQAGDTPCVVNLSVGRHGGPHNGLTLVEQAIDAALVEAPGRCVVQSTGNYYAADSHAEQRLAPGQAWTFRWITDRADVTPNELEVWYPGRDVLTMEIRSPGMEHVIRVGLGQEQPLEIQGQEVGRAYHRARDPGAGDNHINVFLAPAAPAGEWQITLRARDVVDGRVHVWVERDAGCPSCQSRLSPQDAVANCTTGTICNGFRSISVGAYRGHSPRRELAPFSSAGPTRDGRSKPDLVAPGVRVLAARSAPQGGAPAALLVRQSGTSMAAPHVTGTVALIFEAAGRPLAIHETRSLLFSAAESPEPDQFDGNRHGSGFLNVAQAVALAEASGDESSGEDIPPDLLAAPTAACQCQRADEPAAIDPGAGVPEIPLSAAPSGAAPLEQTAMSYDDPIMEMPAFDQQPWDDDFAASPQEDEFDWEPFPLEVGARTDPTYWFLTRDQIERTRGSGELPRTLSVYTSNNLVQPLIDGQAMMRALRADIAAAGRGDFIHYTAWRMTRDVELVPGSGDTVERLWTAAMRRGAMSRTLLWRPAGGMLVPRSWLPNGRENAEMQRLLERAGGQAVLDARFPRFGSHHQKSGVVLRSGEAVAYCGGIDLAPDRWDTQQHDSPRGRRREMYDGWHDVHTRLRGPAVRDIELNFRDRWNDTETPSTLPPVRPPPRITGPLPPVASSPGTHHVQVLRTFACGGNYRTFAPAGERTCLEGYRKAIRQAESYIYIEDQYLVFRELAQELNRALDRIEKLVIVVPRRADMAEESFHWHQADFIRILRSRHPGKVHVYHLVQPGTRDPDGGGPRSIYVHCKLMIVDDIYAVIGSSNIGRRSMTYDSELDVAVVDADVVDGVCRYARDLRRSLWGEHLNLPPGDRRIADPISGVAEWERQATAGTFRVRRHVPARPQDEQPLRWNQVYDPDGRCPSGVPLIAAAAMDDRELALVAAEQLEPWLAQERLLPGEAMASLFEAACGSPAARRHFAEQFDIVAGPGSVLSVEPEPGDVLVRCPLGEGIREQFAVLATGELLRADEAIASGLRPESSLAGWYAEVLEMPSGNLNGNGHGNGNGHAPLARRLGDASGRLPLDTLLVRPLGELLALAENPPRGQRRRQPARTITFDEPLVINVPVTGVGGRGESAGEREVEAELNSLRGYFAAYWDNYHAGLNNFETAMAFASDQETQPRYFDVALKEVGKLLLDQAIAYAFRGNPVLAVVAEGIKNIATAWYDEAQRAQQAGGDRRIAHYIAEIRNQAGTQQGPQLRMLRTLDESRPRILDDYRAAVSRTNIPEQGRQGVLTGEAAVFLQQLRQSVQRFHQAIPPAARFAQLFTERFAASPAWTGLVSHGGRPGGRLYLRMEVIHERSGDVSQWSLGDVDSAWNLATTAPRPDRLATSLRTALAQQGKPVWQTNLPKSVQMRIGIRDGYVSFTREPTEIEIRTHFDANQYRQAWQQPRIRQRALAVNNLRGTND